MACYRVKFTFDFGVEVSMEDSPVLYISLFEVLTDLVVERSKARICGRKLAGIEALNSPGHGCLSHVLGVCLCDGPITHPEESNRLWCVCVFVLGT